MRKEKTMKRKLFIFEDEGFRNFLPLTYSRPTCQLLFGVNTLEQKISFFFPGAEKRLLCRDYLKAWISQKTQAKVNSFEVEKDDQILLINGRVVCDEKLVSCLSFSGEDRVYLCAEEVVAMSLKGSSFNKHRAALSRLFDPGELDFFKGQLKKTPVKANLVIFLWDLINQNGEQIKKDCGLAQKSSNMKVGGSKTNIDAGAVFYNSKQIFIGEQSRIDAFVVLDARKGPIYIDRKVTVLPHTRIEGPCYVGKGSMILGGDLRGGSSFGPTNRIAGEVENSIVLGYSNKYHHGFLGHSYVGEWVNLGALTTNSDLKNNYSPIKVMLNGEMVNTDLTKVGVFLADHVKTGIGTLLNSGTMVGFSTNIFGGGMPEEKFIPSFYWGGRDAWSKYELQKAIETAEITMGRRQVQAGENLKELFQVIFRLTQKEKEA